MNKRSVKDNSSTSAVSLHDLAPEGAAVELALLSLSGCGNAIEDNGTHLAYVLEKGTQQLRASTDSDLVVQYETLPTNAASPVR